MSERGPAGSTLVKMAWACLLAGVLVAALLFKYLCNYNHGAINLLLRSVGLGEWAQDWMMDPRLVGYFIFAMVAWSAVGFFTTLYLANLQTIPTELYEAGGWGPPNSTEWMYRQDREWFDSCPMLK